MLRNNNTFEPFREGCFETITPVDDSCLRVSRMTFETLNVRTSFDLKLFINGAARMRPETSKTIKHISNALKRHFERIANAPYDGGRCNEFWSGDVILGFLFRVRRTIG